tara:strand:+ start:1061 stop:1273 length:213 start_codon:yes stop_codon:yes gene_type:complete
MAESAHSNWSNKGKILTIAVMWAVVLANPIGSSLQSIQVQNRKMSLPRLKTAILSRELIKSFWSTLDDKT